MESAENKSLRQRFTRIATTIAPFSPRFQPIKKLFFEQNEKRSPDGKQKITIEEAVMFRFPRKAGSCRY
ncbi:MAG: hypothetical protein MUC43_11965 [Pirellula sp.]|jgi:hypothetical protein|nr:hypothetical protein [Pirellula sp.]